MEIDVTGAATITFSADGQKITFGAAKTFTLLKVAKGFAKSI